MKAQDTKSNLNPEVTVVRRTVFDDKLYCLAELIPRWVHPLSYVLSQCLKVHGAVDYLIVILDNLGIDWCVKRVRLDSGREIFLMRLSRYKLLFEHASELLHWGDPAYH